jgi:hypothetical protein
MAKLKLIGICGGCRREKVPLLVCGCRGQPTPILFCYTCYDYIHALKMKINYTGIRDLQKKAWNVDKRKLVMVKGK